jgi:hypothetical protein
LGGFSLTLKAMDEGPSKPQGFEWALRMKKSKNGNIMAQSEFALRTAYTNEKDPSLSTWILLS